MWGGLLAGGLGFELELRDGEEVGLDGRGAALAGDDVDHALFCVVGRAEDGLVFVGDHAGAGGHSEKDSDDLGVHFESWNVCCKKESLKERVLKKV